MSVFKLPNGRWRAQVRRKGLPPFEGVYSTKKEAQNKEAAFITECSAPPQSADIVLSNLWLRYEVSREYLAKAAHTRKTEACRIKPILAILGHYSLERLAQRPDLIHDYIDNRSMAISSRTNKRISASSVRLEIAALASIIKWAQQRKIISINFLKDITRPGQVKRKRRVLPVEQAKLANAARQRENPSLAEAARFTLILRRLGCRPGELASVLRTDIRLRDAEITFRNTKCKEQDRRVPLSSEAVSLIDAQLWYALENCKTSLYLFSTLGHAKDTGKPRPWHAYNYSTAINRLRDAEVVPITFHAHAMRREFISRAIEAGMPYATIRKATGHHSTQAIEIYDEGLAIAPDVRKALDAHQQTVSLELLAGHLEELGYAPERVDEAMAAIKGEKLKPYSRVYANGEQSRPPRGRA